MKDSYDIANLLGAIDFHQNSFQNINGMMLTNHEIEILAKYHIPYQKCNSLKEIIFEVEELLDDMDILDEDLEQVSSSIAERDYYQNTNK